MHNFVRKSATQLFKILLVRDLSLLAMAVEALDDQGSDLRLELLLLRIEHGLRFDGLVLRSRVTAASMAAIARAGIIVEEAGKVIVRRFIRAPLIRSALTRLRLGVRLWVLLVL